jgi:hypothetical protein
MGPLGIEVGSGDTIELNWGLGSPWPFGPLGIEVGSGDTIARNWV